MYLLPKVLRWTRGYYKTADVVHRREVFYPGVSRHSSNLPVSEEVVYGNHSRIPAAEWEVRCWHRCEQRRNWRCAVQESQERVAVTTAGPFSRKRGNTVTRRESHRTVKGLEHFHKCLHRQEFHLRIDKFAMTCLLSFILVLWIGKNRQLAGFIPSKIIILHPNTVQGGSTPTQALSLDNLAWGHALTAEESNVGQPGPKCCNCCRRGWLEPCRPDEEVARWKHGVDSMGNGGLRASGEEGYR